MLQVLIVAQSGRMLARLASNEGYQPVIIDCIGDLDTQNLAAAYYKLASLNALDLEPVINTVLLQQKIDLCIYGNGFEAYPESLNLLAKYYQLVGNSATTMLALQNKPDFFQCLQTLNINFPPVSFTQPLNSTNLIKPFQSYGGVNIRQIESNNFTQSPENYYYQQYLSGQVMSVLFLATGIQATIIGYNQQWQQEFIFAGIINHAQLTSLQQQILNTWVQQLTLSYALLGVCSLDFILHQEQCYVLEINPRPPASMQLYSANLFQQHINASLDYQTQITALPPAYTAYQIIYAPVKITIPTHMRWLNECCDLPAANTIIPQDQPICSIIASHMDRKVLKKALHNHQQFVLNQLL